MVQQGHIHASDDGMFGDIGCNDVKVLSKHSPTACDSTRERFLWPNHGIKCD